MAHSLVKNRVLILVVISVSLRAGYSQVPNPAPPPAAAASPPAKPQAQDPLGRDTPRGCVVAFLRTLSREEFPQAVEYLDTHATPIQGQKLAQQLGVVLNQGLSISLDSLSRSPEGDRNDGLRANRERIGSIQTKSGSLDIMLSRVTRGDRPPVWLFSEETLRDVPLVFDEIQGAGIERYVPAALKKVKLFSVPLWRWLILVLSIAFAWAAAAAVTRLLGPALHLAVRRITGETAGRQSHVLTRPIRLLLLALASLYNSRWETSVLSRAFWSRICLLLSVAGVSWLLIVCSDIVSDLRSQRLIRISATDQIAVLGVARRLFKVLVAFAAVLFLLQRAGFDVSALLAGLGIGGIALALGAQKTLEDLLGGIAIISRRAARVGDFCQVGGVTGTIEDIGLSSTRIRTPDRTVITLPNGKISQMNLENYSMRDKIWFHHVFGLRYDTSPETMRSVLVGVNQILRQDSRVEAETARLRFIGFGPSSLNLEVYAYIRRTDFSEFLVIQEELMLLIMDIIGASGTALALPSQITYLDRQRQRLELADKSAQPADEREHAVQAQAVR